MANVDHIDAEQPSSPEELEDALFEELDKDSRFQNGAAQASQGDDVDFINMTGLTPTDSQSNSPSNDEAMNPEAPISFYEKGVGDVDAQMAPDAEHHVLAEDEELVPSSPQTSGDESKTVAGLKEIIADLSGESSTEEAPPDAVENATATEASDAATGDAPAEPEAPEVDLEAITELNLEAASTALEDLGNSTQPEAASVEVAPVDEDADSEVDDTEAAPVAYDFQEAGELIRELEDGEVDGDVVDLLEDGNSSDEADHKHHEPERVITTTVGMTHAERDSTVYNRPLKQGASLRTRKRRGITGKISRWGMRLVFLIAIAGTAYYGWQLYLSRSLSAGELYAQAGGLVDNRAYESASDAYLEFVRRFPNAAIRSDAEFMAGYALYLISDAESNATQAYEESIALFEQFLVDNPGHRKAARAETLLGMLYFRTGRYADTIAQLGDPNRRLRDPGAYLPTLRTVARSYVAEGQIEKARSAFLQAAALENNVEPDKDYLELANVYMTLSERTDNAAMSRRYAALAVEQWDHAVRIPGLLAGQRSDIEAARDVLQSRLMLEQDMASTENMDAGLGDASQGKLRD